MQSRRYHERLTLGTIRACLAAGSRPQSLLRRSGLRQAEGRVAAPVVPNLPARLQGLILTLNETIAR
ncbi:MAG: hypothetical protein NTW21_18495 [Verrucomicrobia bacterium]|nr:hypothetical protein [Verrucomicrobiota bacterium]